MADDSPKPVFNSDEDPYVLLGRLLARLEIIYGRVDELTYIRDPHKVKLVVTLEPPAVDNREIHLVI